MSVDPESLSRLVDPARIRETAWRLASIESPTGQTDEVAAAYADTLRANGLAAEIRYPLADHPRAAVVVGRLRRAAGGKTLEFNGHLDHVDVPHEPARWDGDRLVARGAADMKGAMAAFAEAARVLALPEADLPGNLLVVSHGMHEAPIGHGEDLQAVIRDGIVGDAAIIGEIGDDFLCLIQKGMGIFEIDILREGEPTHELATAPGTLNPIVLGARIVAAIDNRNSELSSTSLEYVGPETCFLGIASGGDFYNRFPTAYHIVGTRRYAPERTYEEVRDEIGDLIRRATGITPNAPEGKIRIRYNLQKVKDGFRLSPDEPIARAVADAYRIVNGRDLPPGGSSVVGDGPLFVNEARVPAVYHGPGGQGAHADVESVHLDDLARVAREYVIAAMLYLRSA